jgi:hypothetical protein
MSDRSAFCGWIWVVDVIAVWYVYELLGLDSFSVTTSFLCVSAVSVTHEFEDIHGPAFARMELGWWKVIGLFQVCHLVSLGFHSGRSHRRWCAAI